MEKRIKEEVKTLLLAAGWAEHELLEDQSIYQNGNVYRPDIILVNNLYPLAIVEIKATDIDTMDLEFKNQILGYLDSKNIPVGYLTNLHKLFQISKTSREFYEIEKFPEPSEIWEQFLGYLPSDSPQRVSPIHLSPKPPRTYQIEAINRAVTAVINGDKRISVMMQQGSGKTYVGLQICWKLFRSRVIQRAVILTDRLELSNSLCEIYSKYAWKVSCLSDISKELSVSDIYISTIQKIRTLKDVDEILKPGTLVVCDSEDSWDQRFGNLNSDFIVLMFSSKDLSWEISRQFPPPVFKYTDLNLFIENYLTIPEGYVSRTLDEIAESVKGVSPDLIREVSNGNLTQIKVIRASDLRGVNAIEFDQLMIVPKKLDQGGLPNRFKLVENDILISMFPIKDKFAVILLAGKNLTNTTFATSLIRIRVRRDLANPNDVYKYLISDAGQSGLNILTSQLGSVVRLNLNSLTQIPILLPITKKNGIYHDIPSSISNIKLLLQEQVIPILDESDITVDINRRNQLAEKLRQLANILAPLPLEEKILKSYPTPIALSVRKYRDAKFNIYEQVSRLRDVFEAMAFYVYNIVLSDALHRLDPNRYFIQDRGARRAYNGYSMSARLDFINGIIDRATHQDPNDLFIPEIVQTTFVEQGKAFQDRYRNRLSHSATATENQQKKILEEFEPIVMNILSELEFLTKYRLVRIPSFYFQDGQWKRRMEIYHGVVPEIDEQSVSTESGLISVDRNHLVLLNEEDQHLCLYPLYQVYASAETRNENHICFLKQRKKEKGTLEGESVQGAFEITINGYDEFEHLQNRIIDAL